MFVLEEIKISQALEREKERPFQEELKKALRENEEGKEKRNLFLILGLLVGILLFTVGGFKAYEYFTSAQVINIDDLHQQNLRGGLDEKEGYLYGAYSFVYVDGLWWTEMDRGNILLKVPLHFGPREVEEVKIEGHLDDPNFNQGEEVYVVIDPEFANKYYSLALSELSLNIVKGINRKPTAVCSKENEICEGREILNCEETQGKPVIELRYGGEPKIILKGTCILITGEDYGLVKAADRLIWQWYGVMN